MDQLTAGDNARDGRTSPDDGGASVADETAGHREVGAQPRSGGVRLRVGVAGAAAAACLLGMLFAAGPADAATSGRCYYNSSRTCYPSMSTDWAPWSSPTKSGAQYWTIKKGTKVDMRCWTTGATRLNTAKWFKVTSRSYPYTQGYVPANAVTDQISVGHC